MKGFMKGCGIAAVILILVGILLAFIGGTQNEKGVIGEVVNQVTDGKVKVNMDDIKDWGVTINKDALVDVVNGLEGTVNYDIEDETIFDNDIKIYKGDVEMDFTGDDIRDLSVEVGGCTFTVEESEDSTFHVKAQNSKKFQGYVKDGVLHIRATTNTVVNDNNTCDIVLSIPAGFSLEEIDLEVGAGVMDLGNIRAEKIDMEVGAGQIKAETMHADSLDISAGVGDVTIAKMQVNKLDIEVGLGNLKASGTVAEKIIAECAMGNIDLKILGAWDDYDYSIECGMGNVEIGNETYSGVANEKSVDNGSDRKMEVECGMGNITIDFTE